MKSYILGKKIMINQPEYVLNVVCESLKKDDPNLYGRLSPLGSQLNNQNEVLIYSLAEEGTHYSKQDWTKFSDYYEALKKQYRW